VHGTGVQEDGDAAARNFLRIEGQKKKIASTRAPRASGTALALALARDDARAPSAGGRRARGGRKPRADELQPTLTR
jgi:hypothetical protein